MKINKIGFFGIMGIIMATAAANAATLATEGFVRGGIANAKTYSDTVANTAEANAKSYTDTIVAGIAAPNLDGYATKVYADTAATNAVNAAATNYATAAQGALANTALQPGDIDLSGYATTTALNSKQDALNPGTATAGQVLKVDSTGALVWGTDNESSADVSSKANLATGATAGNIAIMDASGQYADSNVAMSTITDAVSELGTKQDAIVGGADAGKVLVGTATGFEWVATTSDTFTELP